MHMAVVSGRASLGASTSAQYVARPLPGRAGSPLLCSAPGWSLLPTSGAALQQPAGSGCVMRGGAPRVSPARPACALGATAGCQAAQAAEPDTAYSCAQPHSRQQPAARDALRSCAALLLAAIARLRSRLQAGGPGAGLAGGARARLLAAGVLAGPLLPGGGLADLGTNYVFMAGFWAWFMAQSLKIVTRRLKKGVWDLRAIVDSGGMPSSHSALCMAVTTAIGVEFGLGSSLFACALCFSLIVMYDAAGVRRHAGKQAEVLNVLLEDLLSGHPISTTKLKEVLGHTPLQVGAGALLGVLVGYFFPLPPPPLGAV